MGVGGREKQAVHNLLAGSLPSPASNFLVRLCYPGPLDIHWGRTHSNFESGSGGRSQSPFRSGQMEPQSLSCCGSFHTGHNIDCTRAQPLLRGRLRWPAVLGYKTKAAAAKTRRYETQLGPGGQAE